MQLPPEITPALSGLPAGTPAFTGRDADLSTLLNFLAPHSIGGDRDFGASGASPPSAVVVAAVGGLAGIGKTELAVQAARAALSRGWFPGGVLFVDLFGYDLARSLNPDQALEGFLRALAIPGEHIPPHIQDRTRLYASVLAAYAREGRRILVVIDNAATHEQAKLLLPAEPAGTAIVTSRDTLGLLGARLVDLDTLAPDDAAGMLDRALRVRRPGDARVSDHPADAVRIARLCGGLPLALQIIAALLSENPDRPLAEMATDLKDERTRLDEFSYANITVRAAFDLSYHRLDPDRSRLFRLLTINLGPEISTRAAAILADVDQPAARRGLEALARAHLIDHGSSYGMWRMHDLLHLYASELADTVANEREQAVDRLLSYYTANAEAADIHMRALADEPVPAVFASREKALAWLDTERSCLVASVALAAATGHDQDAMRLSFNIGTYLYWQRRLDDLLTVMTITQDVARQLGDRETEARALSNLGLALQELRRFEEAITACQNAAAIFQETGDRQREGKALNNLGLALKEARRFEEAITAHQRAAAIFREAGDRREEANALNNLGLALRHVERFDEAITAHRQDLAICREIADRRSEGTALNSLGLALAEIGRFEEAIAAHQQAMAIFQEETRDRHGEGRALNSLGQALREAGRFAEAITAHQQAVAIFQETGDRHEEGIAVKNLRRVRDATRGEE